MCRKFLILFFGLLHLLHAFGEQTYTRDSEASESIVHGSEPSRTPTGGLVKSFSPMHRDLFNDLDISAGEGYQLVVGYGVYDEKDNNCIYAEKAISDTTDVSLVFEQLVGTNTKRPIFNGHSYALSRNPMSFAMCQSNALKYGGYPAVITTKEENDAIQSFFPEEDMLIGIYRTSCGEPYQRYGGGDAYYTNFYRDDICNPSRLYTKLVGGTNYWFAMDNGEEQRCLIEFDTPDWKKPLRVCAPWWQIERIYMLPRNKTLTRTYIDKDGTAHDFDLAQINQADFPKRIEVCSQYEALTPQPFRLIRDVSGPPMPPLSSADLNRSSVVGTLADGESITIEDYDGNSFTGVVRFEPAPSHERQCLTYYDRQASERCANNPQQDSCFVDLCSGIKKRCTFIESQPAPKEYTKVDGIVGGQVVPQKGAVEVMMHKYQCPVEEVRNCLVRQTVEMLPQPCPGMYLDETGEMVYIADESVDTSTLKPIRVYGNTKLDGGNKYDANGVLRNLYGQCPTIGDVTLPPIEIPVDVLAGETRTCLRYDQIEHNRTIFESCSLDRTSSDVTVNASLEEVDANMVSGKCIRVNDVQDARKPQTADFSIVSDPENRSRIKVTKVYMNGAQVETDLGFENVTDYYGTKIDIGDSDVNSGLTAEFDADQSALDAVGFDDSNIPSYDCSAYDSGSDDRTPFWDQVWNLTRSNPELITDLSNGTGWLLHFGYQSDAQCQAKRDFHAGSTILYGAPDDNVTKQEQVMSEYAKYNIVSFGLDSTSLVEEGSVATDRKCLLFVPLVTVEGDIFNRIKIDDYTRQYATYRVNKSMSFNECYGLAQCMRASVISSVDAGGATGGCEVATNSNNGLDTELIISQIVQDEVARQIPLPGTDTEVIATGESAVFRDEIDGLNSIYLIESITDNPDASNALPFGYFSTYQTKLFSEGQVTINGNKAHPLSDLPVTAEIIHDEVSGWQKSYRNSKDEPVTGHLLGVGKWGGYDSHNGATTILQGAEVALLFSTTLGGAVIGSYIYRAFQPSQVTYAFELNSVLFQELDNPDFRFVRNPIASYESRLFDEGANRITYNSFGCVSDTHFPGHDWGGQLARYIAIRKENLIGLNVTDDSNEVFNTLVGNEAARVTDPDGCDWWNPWCQKERYLPLPPLDNYAEREKLAEGDEDGNVNPVMLIRSVNTFYLNADNTVSIVVPFKGDYNISAYDAAGALVAYKRISAGSLTETADGIGDNANALQSTRIEFGTNMNIYRERTSDLDRIHSGAACEDYRVAVIGGGIPGVYYESGYTEGSDAKFSCARASDSYVSEHAITTLSVRDSTQGKSFTVRLTKPMPFVNRFFLISLGKEEERVYRCYEPFGECTNFSKSTE